MKRHRDGRSARLWRSLSVVLPFLAFLLLWQLSAGGNPRLRFLFASPALVWSRVVRDLSQASLLGDIGVTALETILGFLLGCIAGSAFGLLLWFSENVAKIARPYVIAFGSIPIFSVAPMMIIWFGTSLFSKVMMAALSTVVVALFQAYEGARNVDPDLITLAKSFGASKFQTYRKIIVPASLVWVLASYRLNIGFALLGAFIGEFISSEAGLGHYILQGGGLYDVPQVLAGVTSIIMLSLVMSFVVGRIERLILPWKYRNKTS